MNLEVKRPMYRDIQFSVANGQLSKVMIGDEEITEENTMRCLIVTGKQIGRAHV